MFLTSSTSPTDLFHDPMGVILFCEKMFIHHGTALQVKQDRCVEQRSSCLSCGEDPGDADVPKKCVSCRRDQGDDGW